MPTVTSQDLGQGTDGAAVRHGNIYVGGLRARLIRDSLFQMIRQSLDSLQWFDPGRQHTQITWRESEVPSTEEIALNTLALSDANTGTVDWELGSNLAQHSWDFWIDFYAEDAAIGIHLIRDIQDILEGRMPSIGRNTPEFDVFDYSRVDTPLLFTCEIQSVDVDKAHVFSRPWQKHWYAINLTVLDYYGSEDDLVSA